MFFSVIRNQLKKKKKKKKKHFLIRVGVPNTYFFESHSMYWNEDLKLFYLVRPLDIFF